MLPVHLDLTNQQVLIAGGGKIAARRAEALCIEPCHITIVSPDISKEMARLIDTYNLNWKEKKVEAEDVLTTDQLGKLLDVILRREDDITINKCNMTKKRSQHPVQSKGVAESCVKFSDRITSIIKGEV